MIHSTYVTTTTNLAELVLWLLSVRREQGARGSDQAQDGSLSVVVGAEPIVDCTGRNDYHGCNGGDMAVSFLYVKDYRRINTEISYPYQGHVRAVTAIHIHTFFGLSALHQSQCYYKRQFLGSADYGYFTVYGGNERRLQYAVATVGPVCDQKWDDRGYIGMARNQVENGGAASYASNPRV
uniref:Peptidase C1A papain C-terminal domain-containing protein n=1 Tax=Plectus sambesii TaxID=2011161 RepID=A0A914W924_9BILA